MCRQWCVCYCSMPFPSCTHVRSMCEAKRSANKNGIDTNNPQSKNTCDLSGSRNQLIRPMPTRIFVLSFRSGSQQVSFKARSSSGKKMNLVKIARSRFFYKTLSIKNFKHFSSAPEPQDHERAKKTSLFDFHVARAGKIVNFAGYLLPVQYADQGIVQSHLHTRSPGCASIFDVRGGIFFVTKK